MIRIFAMWALMVVMLSGMACTRGVGVFSDSPDILATDARISHVRSQLAIGSAHHIKSLAALQERVLSEDLDRFERTENDWNYARSYLAQSAAFLFRLTGEQRYADIAYRTLEAVYEDPEKNHRFPESGEHGLSRATVGLGFALAYAWCGEVWGESQRNFVRSALHRSLEMWKGFRHVNLGSVRGSNWVSVCRGSELIQILALGEREQRYDRYEYLIQELSYHINHGFDGIGATQEGVGYTDYGAIFLLPAIIASADAGDPRLLQLLRSEGKQLHLKAAYAHSPAAVPQEHRLAGRNITLYSGVGGLGAGNQGWPSLLLAITPPDELPLVQWWYDHTFSVMRPTNGGHLRDIEPFRQAAIWSLLFYPDTTPRSPEGHWPLMIHGAKGRHYIRQRWRDERDIMLNIHAQTSYHSRAWSMVELGQWSLAAYGRMLVGGPRRERSGQQHSMLLVGDQMGTRRDFGRVLERSHDQHTAQVVIDGDDHYRNLGVDNYQRHLLAHFSRPDENTAVLALLDRLDAYQEGTFHWGLPIVDEALVISIDNEHEYPQVVISTPEGGRLTLWLVSPYSLQWQQEEGRVWFSHTGYSGEFLLAMSLRDDAPGQFEILEIDPRHRHLRIDGVDLIHDRVADRLLVAEAAQAWQKPQELPKIGGLEAQVAGEDRITLRWFVRSEGMQDYLIQGRSDASQDFVTLQRAAANQRTASLNGLQPGSTYEFRLVRETGAGQRFSEIITATTWDAGQVLLIEDFALREADHGEADATANNLGQWNTANQDRGWKWHDGQGSERGARAEAGHMRTDHVRIGKSNAFFLDGIQADLSGQTAALEVDIRTQNATSFAPLIRLADGRWLRAKQMVSVESRNIWQTQRWDFAVIDSWVEIDLETVVSAEEVVDLNSGQLSTVTGIGVYGHWPLNKRWARIDQLHLYGRDVELTSEK